MSDYVCRICKCRAASCSALLESSLPLAADVRTTPSKELPRYPLRLVRCGSCGHIQLEGAVPENLYENYLFTPSYTADFSADMDAFCHRLNDAAGQKEHKHILEIGSSNGSLLKRLQDAGWNVLGIEPSAPLVKDAQRQGVDTIHGYFERAALAEIRKRIGTPDVVIMRHVLEHLEHLDEMIGCLRELLSDGLLVIEVPYVKNPIQENRFYDFFHEHLSYFSVTTLSRLLGIGEFYIHHIYETPEVGGSILVFADHNRDCGPDDNAAQYIQDEKDSLSEERIASFCQKVPQQISSLKAIVAEANRAGKTAAGWGAGQRGCTLIAYCGFQADNLKYVIDANENYWWKYVPGTDIPIVPPVYYKEHMVDEILIFSTGYADSIIKTNHEFEQMGGSFIKISAI